jgi:hypothetical protein
MCDAWSIVKVQCKGLSKENKKNYICKTFGVLVVQSI